MQSRPSVIIDFMTLLCNYMYLLEIDESAAVLRMGNRDTFGIIIHIFSRKHICDPSLEPSRRDGSNEGSQYMFSLRNKKNHL